MSNKQTLKIAARIQGVYRRLMFWKKMHNHNHHTERNSDACTYHAVAVTDTGCVRNHNEDAVRFVRPAEQSVGERMGCLAIVADGMGGHTSGEIASAIAIDMISEAYYEKYKDPVKALEFAAARANEMIWQAAGNNEKLKGMGTTCTAVAIVQNRLYLLHIGDSRAYLFKDGRIIQLSEDHTYVQQLVRSGKITPAEARNHPDSNVLTKSLGTAKKRECDVFLAKQTFEPTDKLLLCSDGLYEYFTDEDLEEFMRQTDLTLISQRFKQAVMDQGAHDNFSILLVELKEESKSATNFPTRFIFEEI